MRFASSTPTPTLTSTPPGLCRITFTSRSTLSSTTTTRKTETPGPILARSLCPEHVLGAYDGEEHMKKFLADPTKQPCGCVSRRKKSANPADSALIVVHALDSAPFDTIGNIDPYSVHDNVAHRGMNRHLFRLCHHLVQHTETTVSVHPKVSGSSPHQAT